MAKSVHRLTSLAVSALHTPGMHADGNGLYLQLSNSGAKSWVFRFRYRGKRRDMGLGTPATMSLASARAKVLDCRRLLLEGIDPIEARAAERRSGAQFVTFREAFETFFEVKRK